MKTLNSMLKAISFFIVSLSLMVHLQAREINYTVEKIWDNGLYNSFTSLVKYKNQYYCAFREGKSHIFDENGKAEGKIRIISSPDGHRWQSVCLLGENGEDYRDPQLSITPWASSWPPLASPFIGTANLLHSTLMYVSAPTAFVFPSQNAALLRNMVRITETGYGNSLGTTI